MFIYKVKSLKTREYYFGFTDDTRDKFDPTVGADPWGKFPMGFNGQAPMQNAVKEYVATDENRDKLLERLAGIAKDCENDPNFLGVFGIPEGPKVKVLMPTETPITDVPQKSKEKLDNK